MNNEVIPRTTEPNGVRPGHNATTPATTPATTQSTSRLGAAPWPRG